MSSPVVYDAFNHVSASYSLRDRFLTLVKVPSFYLYAANDNAIPLAAQQSFVANANPGAFKITATISSGHFEFISQPVAVARFINQCTAWTA